MIKKAKLINNVVFGNSDLLKDLSEAVNQSNIVVYINSFNEESAKQFYTDFNSALKGGQSLIPVVIDSYGGNVDSLLFMMDIIESSPVPVATFAIGKAMSCGSVLLTAGTKGMRFIAPTARVMIHHVSSTSWGKEPDVQIDAKELTRLQQVAFTKMAKNCGKSKNYFLEQLKKRGNTDWFLTPQECKKHGLVDHIKVPVFSTNVIIQNVIS